ncbi:hypothetical protein [Raoultella planticola]|uniref:Uncharacterized protein n=1 Tax=Raoultella planticola TaxID=575 RepID=A0AAN5R9F2_RAOPL|nr:hypothetical protein [Raoultella planticola]EJR0224053.1 hypothetical protein [Raoultella planticola]EJR0352491.1 hypothetical protein [Raoultella planticola]MDV1449367.1 hypothetical protein [Raoultella planticola]MDV1564703.1 hypothetical protein [Raoultella planticola]MDV1570891.1 hypothetical protein [Raoultella planticola]
MAAGVTPGTLPITGLRVRKLRRAGGPQLARYALLLRVDLRHDTLMA